MTVRQLLAEAGRRGIRLEARAGRIRFHGPRGAMTPELRAEFQRHRGQVLAALEPPTAPLELVPLLGGLVVPLPALCFALDLEARGFSQCVVAEGAYRVEPADGLTEDDRAAIARWHRHLAALVAYEAPEVA